MTLDQVEARFERVAIMTIDGGVSMADAENYCDSLPWIYGIKKSDPLQAALFTPSVQF